MNLNYKRLIVAKNSKIQKALLADPWMLELAREHNRLDLELYEFALNEIFPRLSGRRASIRRTRFRPTKSPPTTGS